MITKIVPEFIDSIIGAKCSPIEAIIAELNTRCKTANKMLAAHIKLSIQKPITKEQDCKV